MRSSVASAGQSLPGGTATLSRTSASTSSTSHATAIPTTAPPSAKAASITPAAASRCVCHSEFDETILVMRVGAFTAYVDGLN